MIMIISSSDTAFEYRNMPPPINVGDNPMYVGADNVASSGPPSSQNTLSRQFMNPLYDYDEEEGKCVCLPSLDIHLYSDYTGDATVLTNPKAKQ